MAIIDIVRFPDARLAEASKPIDPSAIASASMQSFFDDLMDTMYAKDGVGLAAIQIGNPLRVFILNIAASTGGHEEKYFINPMVSVGGVLVSGTEGCLSFPGIYLHISRGETVSVTASDRDGAEFVWEAKGLLARAVQHEMDHLDGKLFIDRVGHLKRQMTLKKYAKSRG